MSGNGQGGHGILITAIVPANVVRVEFEVRARWRSPGGIDLGWRVVPIRIGAQVNTIGNLFAQLCQQGVMQKRAKNADGTDQLDADGNPILELVTDHFVVVPPPKAEPEPPETIIVPV